MSTLPGEQEPSPQVSLTFCQGHTVRRGGEDNVTNVGAAAHPSPRAGE